MSIHHNFHFVEFEGKDYVNIQDLINSFIEAMKYAESEEEKLTYYSYALMFEEYLKLKKKPEITKEELKNIEQQKKTWWGEIIFKKKPS